jgi:hypothetical protein
MSRKLLLEQFHLDVYVPQGLTAAEVDAMRRTLWTTGFRARLRRAAERVFRRHRSLQRATVEVSR